MMNFPIIAAMINFLKGLVNTGSTYSMKRWNAMKIFDVMLMLTIADFAFNNFVIREFLFYGWIATGSALLGITTFDKRIDARKEIEMEKAKKDLDLNANIQINETHKK